MSLHTFLLIVQPLLSGMFIVEVAHLFECTSISWLLTFCLFVRMYLKE